MRVLQAIPFLNVGGVERGVVDLVRYFKGSDIENIVISGGGTLAKEIQKEKVNHYCLGIYKKSPFSLLLINPLRKIIEKENIDIHHARSRVPAWIGFFASRATNASFITTAHGVYSNRFWSEPMAWGKFVICPSKIVARHMKENFGVAQEKIVIINRWVDLNKFKFTDYRHRLNNNTIVSIGRIAPAKGYEYLIESFKKLVRTNPYLILKIVGAPDKTKMNYYNYLKTLTKRFSLEYNVQFSGFREDVENVLKDARMLIASSIEDESFGRVIVEAFACGVPVIATRVGGFNEVIEDKVDGILVDPKDSNALTDSILSVIKDDALANGLVLNGRKKAENLYSMDKCLEQTRDVYKKTISFKRILAVKISSLGDIILSLPSLKAIKENFPDSKVNLLTSKKYSPFFYKKLKNILELSKNLRRRSFDYIIDLQNSRASHLISFLSLPSFSFGFKLRWGGLLTKKVPYDTKDNPLNSQEKILKLLGITLKQKKLVFWEQKQETKPLLPDGSYIGIAVCASSRWESKNWPVDNITHFIDMAEKNFPLFKIVLIGDKTTEKTAENIEANISNRVINLCGKISLSELPGVIKKLKAFITPDTATLHLACALNIPVIALFGPTDPRRHTIQSDNLRVCFKKDTPCLFCYQPECRQQKEHNACMEHITPSEVFHILKEILANMSD